MLSVKQTAPAFTATNQNDETVHLADFADRKNVVLYFYPKDDTPGCTIEANQFSALINRFEALDTVIIGVSKDGCESHRQFINKFDLKVQLLADTEGAICAAYDVWQEKEKNGVKKMGIVRSTFIIDKSGTLADVEYGVVPDGHAQVVLDKIKAL